MASNEPKHPEVRHEETDVHIPGILWFGAGLVVLGLVTWLSMVWVFKFLDSREEEANRSRFPLAVEEKEKGIKLPERPRLEEVSRSTKVGQAEQKAISRKDDAQKAEWLDKEKETVRIPVTTAMKKLLDSKSLSFEDPKETEPLPPPNDAAAGRAPKRKE